MASNSARSGVLEIAWGVLCPAVDRIWLKRDREKERERESSSQQWNEIKCFCNI